MIVLIYKKSDKTDSSNRRGISVLPTTYKIVSNILLSRFTPYAEEIIGITNVNFKVKVYLLDIHSAVVKYL